ncbi:hypothetical protein PGTUg99_022217 [Puccinia graminis f. sp. tritici]|uniref:Uncharacterized protein n=1 Tax=Puccinia graminis f. sp. tritici TaxID=56615 RepID=A0A5B0S6W6_PUCGR|nr:hypothetical protein PGTUg99_022217 [Puccinia graminis f. sp. tritici]
MSSLPRRSAPGAAGSLPSAGSEANDDLRMDVDSAPPVKEGRPGLEHIRTSFNSWSPSGCIMLPRTAGFRYASIQRLHAQRIFIFSRS